MPSSSSGNATASLEPHSEDLRAKRPRGQKARRDCPVCQKVFTKLEHLVRHVRSHTKERPFFCATCGKSYSRNDTLKRHERGHGTTALQNDDNSMQPLTGDDISNEIVSYPMASFSVVPEPSETQLSTVAAQKNTLPAIPSIDRTTALQAGPPLPHTQQGSDVYELSTAPPNDDIFGQPDEYPLEGWLLSEDFDIGAVDLALNASISEWAQPTGNISSMPGQTIATASAQPLADHKASALFDLAPTPQSHGLPVDANSANSLEEATSPAELVHLQWYTQLKPDEGHILSRAASEPPEGRLDVDERYRDKLSRQLSPRTHEATSLSVDFLNICLRLYFEKFNQVFRVVHMPTFKPRASNSLLFLSMCSIGSLFVGSSEATAQGHKIFARLNKAILAAWESHLASSQLESLSMLQAALIGQTFGMLSGRPNDLILVDSFQGTLLAWARKLGAFKNYEEQLPLDMPTPESLTHAWHGWVFIEHLRRLAVALLIHDSELAGLFQHDPLMRHATMLCTTPLNDAMFQAPNATKWLQLYLKLQKNRQQMEIVSLRAWKATASPNSIDLQIKESDFGAYGILSSIHAQIVEARQEIPFPEDKTIHLTRLLTSWYTVYNAKVSTGDPYCLMALWHLCFISLSANLDQLELYLGREGPKVSNLATEGVRAWASSRDAWRCLFHVYMLQDQVENLRMSATPPVHVPRALFSAGVIWICFSRSTQRSGISLDQRNWNVGLPEVELISHNSQGRNAAVDAFETMNLSQHHSSAVYGLIHLLRKLGRWGITENFVGILKAAINGNDW